MEAAHFLKTLQAVSWPWSQGVSTVSHIPPVPFPELAGPCCASFVETGDKGDPGEGWGLNCGLVLWMFLEVGLTWEQPIS
jgi:hypothetical protein